MAPIVLGCRLTLIVCAYNALTSRTILSATRNVRLAIVPYRACASFTVVWFHYWRYVEMRVDHRFVKLDEKIVAGNLLVMQSSFRFVLLAVSHIMNPRIQDMLPFGEYS